MEKEMLKEISKECNLFERIGIKLMQRIIFESYHKGRKDCFNDLQK